MDGGAGPEAALALIPILIIGFVLIISMAGFVFWIWMLIDCAQNAPSENNTKLVWILVLVFAGWLGAIIYFFVQRPKNPPAGGGP